MLVCRICRKKHQQQKTLFLFFFLPKKISLWSLYMWNQNPLYERHMHSMAWNPINMEWWDCQNNLCKQAFCHTLRLHFWLTHQTNKWVKTEHQWTSHSYTDTSWQNPYTHKWFCKFTVQEIKLGSFVANNDAYWLSNKKGAYVITVCCGRSLHMP